MKPAFQRLLYVGTVVVLLAYALYTTVLIRRLDSRLSAVEAQVQPGFKPLSQNLHY